MTYAEKVTTATAIATCLTACLAFIVAVWQAWVTRKHNRLSVRPLLAEHEHYDSGEHTCRLAVRNGGVGPAIIEAFVVTFDGEEVVDLGDVIKRLNFAHDFGHEYTAPGEKPVVQPSEEFIVLD